MYAYSIHRQHIVRVHTGTGIIIHLQVYSSVLYTKCTHIHTRVHARNITHSILACEGTRRLASELATGLNCINFHRILVNRKV